jgi:hypothetical protein
MSTNPTSYTLVIAQTTTNKVFEGIKSDIIVKFDLIDPFRCFKLVDQSNFAVQLNGHREFVRSADKAVGDRLMSNTLGFLLTCSDMLDEVTGFVDEILAAAS